MKKILMTIMMFALMAVLVACGSGDDKEKEVETDGADNAAPVEETEDEEEASGVVEITHELDKNPVEVVKNPETVVVFDFGMLDTLMELDVEVAGLPKKTIPPYLSAYEDEKYEDLGSLKEPHLEKIHEMNPDVIFISGRQADMYDELSKIAPTVYVGLDTNNYMESFKHNMDIVAQVFDKEDEIATELAEIDEQIAAINEKASATDEKALIVLGTEGKVSAYGPSSRFGLVHDVFGFAPADEQIEASTHGQSITFEYILETNPDILFVIDRDAAIGGEASAKDSIENDLVKKTKAFENDAIYYLDPSYWYLSGGGLLSIKEMIKEVDEAL